MQPSFTIQQQNGTLIIAASGPWTKISLAASSVPDDMAKAAIALLEESSSVRFTAEEVTEWDSILLSSFHGIAQAARAHGIAAEVKALPSGMASMLEMALAVPPRNNAPGKYSPGFLETVGEKTLAWPGIIRNVVEFIGEVSCSMARFLSGRASCSSRDFWNVLRECGVDALPIVTLTSLLLGLILAFVSSMQLKLFGAEVYIASLVGVSMVRVMGPVLTGIVLSGRTGASFAAVIGSMQVNEEIDALTGFGISPSDFLVLPRVLGLAIMTPLLTLYADIAG
ncbi:MAG: ABC transporter permease, partial [Mailhella sp.]